jgi:hypothetical protein
MEFGKSSSNYKVNDSCFPIAVRHLGGMKESMCAYQKGIYSNLSFPVHS